MNKFTRLIGLSLLVLLVLGLAFNTVGAQDMKVLRLNWGEGDIPSIDPSLGTDTSSIQIITSTTVGLTRIHEETKEIQPGLATWTVSDDGLTYTFDIMEGVSWVRYDADAGAVVQATDEAGNVRYVTAGDFAYGMKRSLDPVTASYYGGVLAPWIVNGSAAHNGEMSLDEVGITVVDDYTLEIQVSQAAAFLPNMFGMWMTVAQPAWAIAEHGDFWTEAENIQTYGAYAVKEWLHDESLTLVKNPFWMGTESVPVATIDEVIGTMIDGAGELANYEAGLLEVAAVPVSDIDRIVADPVLSAEYTVTDGTCTYAFMFNTAKAPFDDARVRRAFSMAVDRQGLIDNVLKAGQQPAYFFTRPDLVAAPTAETNPEAVIGEDDAEAKALIDAYIAEKGALAPIILMHNESASHARIAAALQNMWTETLGVSDIQIQTQEWSVYLETIKNDDTAPQIFRYAWCWDYMDTHNFLFDVWHSSVRELGVSWNDESSAQFDSLVEQARDATDTETRRALYAQAENILSNEQAISLNVYFYTSSVLTKPYVERTFGPSGMQRYEKWDLGSM